MPNSNKITLESFKECLINGGKVIKQYHQYDNRIYWQEYVFKETLYYRDAFDKSGEYTKSIVRDIATLYMSMEGCHVELDFTPILKGEIEELLK